MEKKAWTKPECSRIRLVPQEALARGCRGITGIGPKDQGCYGQGGGQGTYKCLNQTS